MTTYNPKITTTEQLDEFINWVNNNPLTYKPQCYMSPLMEKLFNIYNRAVQSHMTGDKKTAISLYLMALNIAPNLIAPRVNLGNLYRETGDLDSAVKELKKASTLAPMDVDVWISLGDVYDDLLDYKSSIEVYKKALEIQPDHIVALINLSKIYIDNGDANNAEIVLHKASKVLNKNLSPRYQHSLIHFRLNMLYNLGLVYEMQSRWDECINCFEECIRINPNERAFHTWLNNAKMNKAKDNM